MALCQRVRAVRISPYARLLTLSSFRTLGHEEPVSSRGGPGSLGRWAVPIVEHPRQGGTLGGARRLASMWRPLRLKLQQPHCQTDAEPPPLKDSPAAL